MVLTNQSTLIVENIHSNSFKSYVNGFAFLLVNSSGDYRHRWNTLKGRIYQLFGQTDLVLQRIAKFEEAIAVAENGEKPNCVTPPYKHTTHLSKISSFHEFVNRLVRFCKKGHSEDTSNLILGFIKELCDSLDKLKAESSKLLYNISNLLCISGDFEKLDEYILKAILENICADTEESFKKNITGFVVLLITSSEDYINRFSVIKEYLTRTLGNSRFVMQRIGELEKFIPKPKKTKYPDINEKIEKAINEIRNFIAEAELIIGKVPLDLEALSQKTASLCSSLNTIGNLAAEFQIKEIHIPYNDLDNKLLKALLEITKTKPPYTKDIIRMLLEINDRFLKCFSPEDTNLLLNLFDRIEYLRLHNDLWPEYNFKVTVKQAYELGEKIYNNLESYKLGQNRRETTLGMIGEICRSMVEFEVCNPDERIDLLLKSNDILQKAMVRNGELILKYFGRDYLRIGLNYMDLKQWKDAIACFMKIIDIDNEKGVNKKIAFEAMDKIGDCYLKLGIEEKYQPISGSTQYFSLAEKFYNEAGRLPKLRPDDGKHLIGKRAGLYYCSNQYGKALPLYESILLNESSLSEDKNLYVYSSYRKGVCLYFMNEIDKAIKQFEDTLNRHPEKEQKIKSYFWLLKLNSIRLNWIKYEETKRILFSDKELETNVDKEMLDVLLTDKMADYIKEIKGRLKGGDHWLVIDELKNMIRLQKLIEGSNHEDPVLLTKLAEAYRAIGESDLALNIFYRVKDLDNAPKNAAIALAGIGKVYMEKGEYQRAIGAFQKSFEYGHDIRMLSSQASAYCHLKEYDKAIQIYNEILNSGSDKMPWLTKTEIAKAFWSKYHEEGREDDAKKAVDYIASVIEEYPNDQASYDLLVKMAMVNIPNALKCLLSHLENSRILATACLLKELAFKNFFPKDVMLVCINRFASVTPSETDYQLFVRSITDYLMKATIYFYFISKESEDYLKLIDQIFTVILKHQDACSLISEYLCSSRGAYIEYLDSIAVRSVTDKLHIPDDILEKEGYIKTTVIPTIRNMLLYPISFCPNVHYTGYDNYIFPSWKERIERCLENISIEWFNIENKHVPLSLSWYFTENFLKWFLKIHDDSKYLSSSDYKITANIIGLDKNIRIILSTKYSVNPLENIDHSLDTIFNSNTCPIPNNIYGFSYNVDFSQINAGEISATLHIVIGTKVEIVGLPPEFWSFMDSTFNFNKSSTEVINRNEFYNRAKCYFSNCEISSKEQWIDFVLGFIDHHFSLAYLSFLKDEEYHTALHDCKRIADSIMLNNPLRWTGLSRPFTINI